MILVFFGPPGSGKGTQAQYLLSGGNFAHISTGDLLRKEVAEGTELGKSVQRVMENGDFPSDDIIISLVEKAINQSDKKNVVFDGFPRTYNQALEIDRVLGVRKEKVDVVIDFNIDLDLLVERVSGRFSCVGCGTVYHDKFNRPAQEGVCNRCHGTEFIRRKDDQADVLTNRVRKYLEETEVVRDYYEQKGIVKVIDASMEPESVRKKVEETLTQLSVK